MLTHVCATIVSNRVGNMCAELISNSTLVECSDLTLDVCPRCVTFFHP